MLEQFREKEHPHQGSNDNCFIGPENSKGKIDPCGF